MVKPKNKKAFYLSKLREYSPDIMELGQPISLKFAKSKHLTGKIDSIGRADLTPLLVIHTPEQTGLGLTLHATKDSKDAGTETTAPRHTVTATKSTDDAWPGIPEAGISLTPYPNPFSEHLSIAYTLPISGKVWPYTICKAAKCSIYSRHTGKADNTPNR